MALLHADRQADGVSESLLRILDYCEMHPKWPGQHYKQP